MMIAEIPPEQTMWVISNEKGINGAASMLYENELHELAESLESDLYILLRACMRLLQYLQIWEALRCLHRW